MAQAYPAVKGNMGTTEFYMITMKCGDLSRHLQVSKEVKGWDNLGLDEKYQRDLNLSRVIKQIAPYFANDKDRFSGSIIVAYKDGILDFEPIDKLTKNLPNLYQQAAKNLGILTINGGLLIPLDGLHRIKAIRFAISGVDDEGKEIMDISKGGNNALADDDISLIILKFQAKKAREIFNVINQYAKPTSRTLNLITDDSDLAAVIAREDIVGTGGKKGIIHPDLVNYKSSTLSETQPYLITLNSIYRVTNKIADALELKGTFDKFKKGVSSKPEEDHAKEKVLEVWDEIFSNIDLFREGSLDPTSSEGYEKRKNIKENFILGKPAGQEAVISAYLRMRYHNTIPLNNIFESLNKITWDITQGYWEGIAMQGDRILRDKNILSRTEKFIAYLCGDKDIDQKGLVEEILGNLPEEMHANYTLPPPVNN